MTTADVAHAISEAVQGSVWARPLGDDAPASMRSSANEEHAAWQRVIDGVLAEWGRKQQIRDEDGIEWPAAAVVEAARRLASSLQNQGLCPPTRVVPNGEGGLVFEYQHARELQTIEIEADGTIEVCRFKDAKLINRNRISAASID